MLTPSTAALLGLNVGRLRLEVARLLRAAGRVVLRIEVEDDGPAGVVGQAMRVAVLILQREGRRFLSRFDERPYCT